ncbi:VPLPA-CTERM sorting domain-containing protein [Pseudomonadota bacterium]
MKIALTAILSCIALIASLSANASILTLDGGSQTKIGDLPSLFNPSNHPGDINAGTDISIFNKAGEGIRLSGAANLMYTYIGKEAGSQNLFQPNPIVGFFHTNWTPAGSIINTSASSGGFLDFSFLGLGTCCGLKPGVFTNGEGNFGDNGRLGLAVALINPSTAYLMFGDGFGDSDFDDMVVKVEVSAVPLPAAFWLFGTALIGFVGMSRSTKVS